MQKKAVVLLSGGIDSTTTAAIALDRGFELHALTFHYGQRHAREVEGAQRIADILEIKSIHIIEVPVYIFNSALTSQSAKIRDGRVSHEENDIPDTYVPARNILFLSYGLAYAESIDASSIFIGANALDYSGYPDCRPEFFKAYQEMARLGTRAGLQERAITIETPLISLKKSDIILRGHALGVDYSMTHSCYDPDREGRACGRCDSCVIRKNGFLEAGIPDPTIYQGKE